MSDLTGRTPRAGAAVGVILGSGPPGPPGESPHVGDNGNWWVGQTDTGVPASGGGASDHALLTGRDKADQHPINAITGLTNAIERIPPAAEALTNLELEELLT